MAKEKKTVEQQISETKLKLLELEELYATQRYFETMPEYDPSYKYCYSTSNFTISYPQQSLDAWLRAIIKHMPTRRVGHGGAYTDAELISIPTFSSANSMEFWLKCVTERLRKKAQKKIVKK